MIKKKQITAVASHVYSIHKKTTARSFHTHPVTQLSYTVEGVLYVTVANKLWIVPPNRAIWIPKQIAHKNEMHKDLTVKSLYLPDSYVSGLPKSVQLLQLTELAKAAISKICNLDSAHLASLAGQRLLAVLKDELKELPITKCAEISLPENRQLYLIYQLFRSSKDHYPSVDEAARHIHVSTRTLLRLFKKEMGMSFVVWKQQFLFVKAIELLQQYKNIGLVAHKLGYKSDSAFIAMFKKMSGGQLPSHFVVNG